MTDDGRCGTTGRDLPPHLARRLPPLRPHRAGHAASARLARLARFHPAIDAMIGEPDLSRMRPEEIEALLMRAEAMLGIFTTEGT